MLLLVETDHVVSAFGNEDASFVQLGHLLVEDMLHMISKMSPNPWSVKLGGYLCYLFDALETHVKLFGVLRHLKAVWETFSCFMWLLGSVLKAVLDIF